MKRSEEEIKESLTSVICNDTCLEDDKVLTDAINELLTLRRRLEDRDEIKKRVLMAWVSGSESTADAIIKYLTEGSDE